MIVERIDQSIENEVDGPASILLSDGEYECLVFAYPCSLKLGDSYDEPLHGLISSRSNDILSDSPVLKVASDTRLNIKHIGNAYACLVEARVLDQSQGMVQIGTIKIILDTDISHDINKGDVVRVQIDQLSI